MSDTNEKERERMGANEIWYRVDADWGKGWALEGETKDRIGYLALADRAWHRGAKKVRVYRCEICPVG